MWEMGSQDRGCLSKKQLAGEDMVQNVAGKQSLEKEAINLEVAQKALAEVERFQDTQLRIEVRSDEGQDKLQSGNWNDVPPTKVGRFSDKNGARQRDEIVISPSKFSILAGKDGENADDEEDEEEDEGELESVGEEDEKDQEDIEDGEIHNKSQSKSKTGKIEKHEMQTTRPSLPRNSKSLHKFLADSGEPTTKPKPSTVLVKRGLSKKH